MDQLALEWSQSDRRSSTGDTHNHGAFTTTDEGDKAEIK
jgi:hypothetical protein